MHATAVSVIIPAWRAAATLPAALAALERQDLDRLAEFIVVYEPDDRETAETVECRDRIVAVKRPEGLGAGAARNLGAAAARGEVLAFTDADCVPTAGWLRAGLQAMEGADVVQGRVEPDPAVVMGPLDHTVSIGSETGLYETANLFVRRELFERLGGFEDWLPMPDGRPFGEDVLFGWRARRAGARTSFCAESVVEHAVSPRTTGAYVAEQWRRGNFPPLVERVPELRAEFLYRRLFLSRRTAMFDLACAGAAAALIGRSPAPLAVAAPYLLLVARDSRRWGRSAPLAAAAGLVADAVGGISLARSSARHRTPVL